MQFPPKDASDVLDYAVDFSSLLESDTVDEATVVRSGADDALVVATITHTNTEVRFWLSAGTIGTVYTLTIRVTTAANRTIERDARILVDNL